MPAGRPGRGAFMGFLSKSQNLTARVRIACLDNLRRSHEKGSAAALLWRPRSALAQYPQRPVQVIVPWGAGGGTDATARIIATLLEKELKQPFNVVNRTGGSGVVGHDAIAKAPADGYTIGMITVEITMMHHVGPDAAQAHRLHADRPRERRPRRGQRAHRFAVQVGEGPARGDQGESRKAEGLWNRPGRIWHLAIAGLLKDQGIDPAALPWVPSQGAAPGCRTWSQAASMSCRARFPRRAR